MGKTSLACQAVRHATLDLGLPGYYAPLENHEHAAFHHILAAETGIEQHRFAEQTRHPFASWEWDRVNAAAARLSGSALHVDTHVRSISDLDARLRRMSARPPRIVVVDYPTALADLSVADDFEREINTIGLGLKRIAQQRGIPALVTCPLNRRRAGATPSLDDAGQFTGLVRAADTALILDRPDDREPYARIVAAKQPDGVTGSVEVHFEAPFVRFTDGAR